MALLLLCRSSIYSFKQSCTGLQPPLLLLCVFSDCFCSLSLLWYISSLILKANLHSVRWTFLSAFRWCPCQLSREKMQKKLIAMNILFIDFIVLKNIDSIQYCDSSLIYCKTSDCSSKLVVVAFYFRYLFVFCFSSYFKHIPVNSNDVPSTALTVESAK